MGGLWIGLLVGLAVGYVTGARTNRAQRTFSDYRGARAAASTLGKLRWVHGRAAAAWWIGLGAVILFGLYAAGAEAGQQ
jgi:hypothetical protein